MIFTFFDIIILTVITVSCLLGGYKGLIQVIIGFSGFIASIVLAVFFYPYIKNFLIGYVKNEIVISILSGALSYIVSLGIFTFITSKIALLFSAISRGWIDRGLGLIVGFLGGVLISVIFFTTIIVFSSDSYYKSKEPEDFIKQMSEENYPEWLKDSITVSYLEKSLKTSVDFIPKVILNLIKSPKIKDSDSIIKDDASSVIDHTIEKKLNSLIDSEESK